MTSVLVVDGARERRTAVVAGLADRGHDVTGADGPATADRIREADPEVVVLGVGTGGAGADDAPGDDAADPSTADAADSDGPGAADPAAAVERALSAGPTPAVALVAPGEATPDLDALAESGGVAVVEVAPDPTPAAVERAVEAVGTVEGTPPSELATTVTTATARSVRRRVAADGEAGAWTGADRPGGSERGSPSSAGGDLAEPDGARDAGVTDAETGDAGVADAETRDAGVADAETGDAAGPDAGAFDPAAGSADGRRVDPRDRSGADRPDRPGVDAPERSVRGGAGARATEGASHGGSDEAAREEAEGPAPVPGRGGSMASSPSRATGRRARRETPAFEPPPGEFAPTVVVGASTGGPNVVETVMAGLPRSLDARVLVVQHMPASFTGRLAARLDGASEYEVREATDGATVAGGEAVVAPGGRHLRVTDGDADGIRVALTEEEPLHGVRPAVDVTMLSAAEHGTEPLVGVVLTGMGRDGAAGVEALRAAGGFTLAQDRDSSAVFGMPEQAIATGAVDAVRPAADVPAAICDELREASEP